MHDIEPFYRWKELYNAQNDRRSPFFGKEYSELFFENQVYNHYIHPQWDTIGSQTLYLKVLFADYKTGFAIIELIGEWNDTIENDVMNLKYALIDTMIDQGINKFILIGENILNFHASDDCYYQEWFDQIEEGWIVALNFRQHVIDEFQSANIDYYLLFGGEFDAFNWRQFKPSQLYQVIDALVIKRLD